MVMKVRDVLLIMLAIVCIISLFNMYSHADTTTTCTEDTIEKNLVDDIENWGEYHREKLCEIADCANERTETAEELIEQYMEIYEYIVTEMFPHVQNITNPTK